MFYNNYTPHRLSKSASLVAQHTWAARSLGLCDVYNFAPTHLINGTRDEALDVLVGSKDLGEGGAECRSGLDGGETHLADVVAVAKTKDTLGLVHRDTLLNLEHLTVKDWLTAASMCGWVCWWVGRARKGGQSLILRYES